MDFEQISTMAYQKEYLPNNATILEQLVWYKMKGIYDDYAKGIIDLQQSKAKKASLNSFYLRQIRLENFDKDLHDERYKCIRQSEDILKDILQKEDEKIPEKELTRLLIKYIVKITGIVPIETKYKENYEVN